MSKETFEVYLYKIKEINSNYVYCTEGACELLNSQQKKIQDLEERLKLKTTNEVNASVNADCLEGCRVKLKRAEAKITKATEAFGEIRKYNGDTTKVDTIIRKTLAEMEKGE